MKKSMVFAAITAAIGLSSHATYAEDHLEMEKCQVIKEGKGLIKEHKADCKSKNHSCAGQNAAADVESFILVPTGECAKINAGDFSGVDDNIKSKIENAS